MTPIVTLTINPAVDKSASVEQVVPERKLRCGAPEFHPGGGGINVARAITELGGEAKALWACGGVIGELLKKSLDAEGVPHEPLPIAAMTRENFIVYEESSGQQYRFGMPGATLTAEEVDACLDRLHAFDPQPEYLVLSGSVPPDTGDDLYARLAEAVRPPCRVILDTSGAPLRQALGPSIYLVKPNMNELGQLVGGTIENDTQMQEAARTLIAEEKAQVIVTSLGSGGAVVTTAEEHRHIRTPSVKIRSKVGAGDSMVAGIVLGLARKKSLLDAIHFGVAAGAAAVMTDGTELCRREDVERLYREMTG